MVKIKDNLRLNFHYLIQKVVKDGKVPLTVVRQGKTLSIELPVKTKYPTLIQSLKGRYPSYFIYGPLVFSPVTTEFTSAIRPAGWLALALMRQPAGDPPGRLPRFEGEELVVVTSPMFPHRIGKGYDNPIVQGRQGGQRRADQEPPPPRGGPARLEAEIHDDPL